MIDYPLGLNIADPICLELNKDSMDKLRKRAEFDPLGLLPPSRCTEAKFGRLLVAISVSKFLCPNKKSA